MIARLLSGIAMVACVAALGVTLPGSVADAANQKEEVLYRATKWQAKHIHDAKKAETIGKTLKQLGCELQTSAHNGHIDVKYRCPKWKKLSLKTHGEAHKWEKWLKEYGFETQHKH